MIERFSGGSIPQAETPAIPVLEEQIGKVAAALPDRIKGGFETFQFRENIQSIRELVGLCDEYIDKAAPWQLAKNQEDHSRLKTVLNTTWPRPSAYCLCSSTPSYRARLINSPANSASHSIFPRRSLKNSMGGMLILLM